MQLQTKKIAIIGLLTSLALILSYVESLIPIAPGIPGVKPGLPNMLILTALYVYGWREALSINVMRILLAGFLFGNMFSILYSLAGAVVSFVIMLTAKKLAIFPIKAVSILGGVFHNVGQLSVAYIVVDGLSILAYLPVLLVAGLLTGLLNGVLAGQIYKRKHVLQDF